MKKKLKFGLFSILAVVVLFVVLIFISDDEEYYEDGYCADGYCAEDAYYGYEDEHYYENDDSWGSYNDKEYWDIPENTNLSSYDFELGTCGELEGTTLLVSIYLDDSKCKWTENDATLVNDGLRYLGMGTDWITDNAARYGCNARFIYDWSSNSDLYYEGSVDIDMTEMDRYSDDIDYVTWQFIDENIDSKSLMDKYNAENIGYILYINTPNSNNVTSCTRNYYEGMPYPYEACLMFMHCENEKEAPAAFAHEILHTFGAPDFYLVDEDGGNYGVSRELVNELERTSSNDIMYTTYDAFSYNPHYDRISNDFTDADAYYVGLIESCDFVDEWGLEPSQHIRN